MCLSMAFSGRPTLIPTVPVVCLPMRIPERVDQVPGRSFRGPA